MKKIILLVLAALVLVALVACGGETTTTEAGVTTTEADVTTTEAPNSSTEDPDEEEEPNEDALYQEGTDILTGDVINRAILPYQMGTRPVQFENWHETCDFRWVASIAIQDTESGVIDKLLDRTDMENIEVRADYKWVLVIDGKDYAISDFDTSLKVDTKTDSEWVYVRMDLNMGKTWTLSSDKKEYDISLKICDFFTDKIVYWAYLTDPAITDAYSFGPPKQVGIIADPDGSAGEDEYQLSPSMIVSIQGPNQTAVGEFYDAVFDGNAGTKLCTRDMSKDLIFAIDDSVYSENFRLTSISIVGANDDEKRYQRCVTKFVLYGADSEDAEEEEWMPVLTVDVRDSFIATNYGERHYELDKPSSYQYYKLVVVDPQLDPDRVERGPIYQFSELMLFADRASIAG